MDITMKVMLIQPPSGSKYMDTLYMHEPLALEYLGAGLRAEKHEVMIFDARLERVKKVYAYIFKIRPNL